MIIIHRGYVSEVANAAILFTEIEIDDEKKHVLVSVAQEYGKFLSPERADYALLGMLAYALRNRHDIICEAPVTDELLYNLREILIPTLVRTDSRNYPVKIQADLATPLDKLPFAKAIRGGVGTGLSCGVDSFYTVLKHLNSDYPCRNLTHLCIYNIGSINSCYGEENIPRVKQRVFERTEIVAAEIDLPLVKLESNFQDVIPQNHLHSHTYMDALAIYALQKLWRVYYYASGYSFREFTLANNFDSDPSHFELLLLDCFSTSALKIISVGSEGDRNDKINFIADSPLAQKYLHVCIKEETNCGVCEKCLRTMLALDAANKLENFREVFDLDIYNKNRGNAYLFLYEQAALRKNPFYQKSFEILSRRHSDFFASVAAQVKAQQLPAKTKFK